MPTRNLIASGSLALAALSAPARADGPATSGASFDASGNVTADSSGDEPGTDRPTERRAGFVSGLRTGAELPAGKSDDDNDLSSRVSLRVPVWLDLGYRIDPTWLAGIYAQTGLGSAGDVCEKRVTAVEDVSCSFNDFRIGLEIEAHPGAPGATDWWIGGGAGYEHFVQFTKFAQEVLDPDSMEVVTASITIDATLRGASAFVQGGIDFPIEQHLTAGPFASYTLGQFLGRTIECNDVVPEGFCPDGAMDDKGLHHWLALGARGSFGP